MYSSALLKSRGSLNRYELPSCMYAGANCGPSSVAFVIDARAAACRPIVVCTLARVSQARGLPGSTSTSRCASWRWPSISFLKPLCVISISSRSASLAAAACSAARSKLVRNSSNELAVFATFR